MLEVMNKTQQTVAANNIVLLNTVTISDRANRMNFSNGAIQLNFPGKYNIEGYFGLYNSTSAAVNTTIQMYANGVAIDGAFSFIKSISKLINLSPFLTLSQYNILSAYIIRRNIS